MESRKLDLGLLVRRRMSHRDWRTSWQQTIRKLCAAQIGVSGFAKSCAATKIKCAHDSFCAANEAGTFRRDCEQIKLPVIGWVRMREAVRFEGVLKRVTVSREADRWFASVLVKQQHTVPVAQPGEAVGVDLGVSVAALLS